MSLGFRGQSCYNDIQIPANTADGDSPEQGVRCLWLRNVWKYLLGPRQEPVWR